MTAPIFLLVPQVKLSKRLDLAREAARAHDAVRGLIVATWVELDLPGRATNEFLAELLPPGRRRHAHFKRQEAVHHEVLPLRADVALQRGTFGLAGLGRRQRERCAVDVLP